MRKAAMRRLALAAALLLAIPAHAAQWEKSVEASGFTGTRPLLCAFQAKLYALLMHGTTNPAPIVVWDASANTVSSATGRTVTNFNEVIGSGCDSVNSRLYVSGRGRHVEHATFGSLGTWTSDIDASVAAQAYGAIDRFSSGWALGSTADLATDTFSLVYTTDFSSSSGPSLNAASGFANHEETGCMVADVSGTANDIYVGAAIDATLAAAGKVMALGIDGAGNSRWTPNCGTGVGCENGSSAHIVRQCFTNGTLAVTLAYNTSTGATYVTGWASNGTRTISQTLASTDLRSGVYFNLDGGGAALWAWTSAGVAYKSTGGNFSDASGTTHDLVLDGGDTLSGCQLVNGTIPVCLTTGGDVWAFRTPINVRYIGGGSITGTGPIH
jgi:hypothetical protein